MPADDVDPAARDGALRHPWEANFVANMARRRKALGMSQSALAKALAEQGPPFHQPTVQRIEMGERPVRINEAVAIIEILQMNRAGSIGLDDAVDVDSELSVTHMLTESLRGVTYQVSEYATWRAEMRERLQGQWLTLNTVLQHYEQTLPELGVDVDADLVVRARTESDKLRQLIDTTLSDI